MGDTVLEFASEVYKFTSPSSRNFFRSICSHEICTMKPRYKDILPKAKVLSKLE